MSSSNISYNKSSTSNNIRNKTNLEVKIGDFEVSENSFNSDNINDYDPMDNLKQETRGHSESLSTKPANLFARGTSFISKEKSKEQSIIAVPPISIQPLSTEPEVKLEQKPKQSQINLEQKDGNNPEPKSDYSKSDFNKHRCGIHEELVILFATMLIKSANYNASNKVLEEFGRACLTDNLARANIYKLLSFNSIMLEQMRSEVKTLNYCNKAIEKFKQFK